MDNLEELEPVAEEVLGKLKSRQPFQSKWDTAAFVIFLTFVGECGLCLWPVSLPRQVPGRGRAMSGHLSCPQALCCS